MILIDRIVTLRSRSPCGERGLKYTCGAFLRYINKSLPVRGAWIEIMILTNMNNKIESRSPCGERGLKYIRFHQYL